jgi:hypothetical protein
MASFGSSVSGPDTVTVGHAPVFYADSPALTATNGGVYSYAFRAKGFPAPSYALGSGAPSWLYWADIEFAGLRTAKAHLRSASPPRYRFM